MSEENKPEITEKQKELLDKISTGFENLKKFLEINGKIEEYNNDYLPAHNEIKNLTDKKALIDRDIITKVSDSLETALSGSPWGLSAFTNYNMVKQPLMHLVVLHKGLFKDTSHVGKEKPPVNDEQKNMVSDAVEKLGKLVHLSKMDKAASYSKAYTMLKMFNDHNIPMDKPFMLSVYEKLSIDALIHTEISSLCEEAKKSLSTVVEQESLFSSYRKHIEIK